MHINIFCTLGGIDECFQDREADVLISQAMVDLVQDVLPRAAILIMQDPNASLKALEGASESFEGLQ